MSPFAKVFSIVVALYPFVAAADCANGGATCVEERDETSLVQVKKTLKQGSDRVMENSQSSEVQSDTANSTVTSMSALQNRVAVLKAMFTKDPDNMDPALLLELKMKMDVPQVIESINHCFEMRGYKPIPGVPFNAYMHSGTAVNYKACRTALNDIDLWVPNMMTLIPLASKVALNTAYGTQPGVVWEKRVGFTDKDVEEHRDQVYCPQQTIGEKVFKEVDAFVGTGGIVKGPGGEGKNGDILVYPKFDLAPFAGIATRSVSSAQKIVDSSGIHLYVIGTCGLIELKYALINGGRGEDVKPTDIDDLTCLCAAKPAGEMCTTRCREFAMAQTPVTPVA